MQMVKKIALLILIMIYTSTRLTACEAESSVAHSEEMMCRPEPRSTSTEELESLNAQADYTRYLKDILDVVHLTLILETVRPTDLCWRDKAEQLAMWISVVKLLHCS